MAKTYEKIPGLGNRRSFQLATRSSMHRGPDHLLVVHSTGYTEEYKRIFYRDIRYVEVRNTKGQLWVGIISGIAALLFGLFYFIPDMPTVGAILIVSPFLVWFIINLVLGPTVECYISTNVQTLKLPAPRRRRKVTALINFLREQTAAFSPVETTTA